MPRLSRLLHVSLAALLLVVWQGALLHPLKHLDANGGYVHVGGSHSPSGTGDKNGSYPLCDTIAAVTACVGSSAISVLAALFGGESLVFGHTESPRGAPAPAYRSQAPPSFL